MDRAKALKFGAAILSALFLLSLALLALGRATPVFPRPEGGYLLPGPDVEDALLDFLTPELSAGPTETSLPPLPKSLAMETYTVRSGDSLASVSSRFGIKVDTLVSINGIASAKGLQAGARLKIPNMNGIVHTVGKGESLASIAAQNSTTVNALADANNLGSSVLKPGQVVFIPGARLAPADLKRVFGEFVAWPARGPISSWFGYRPDPFSGVRRFHGGIDIVLPEGTPVKAIMDGRVSDVGYSKEFGNYLIVNHADGMQSLFGHLSVQKVNIGQAVSQGQILALSGNTGYSTAAHLHLGLYRNGSSVNPMKYLK